MKKSAQSLKTGSCETLCSCGAISRFFKLYSLQILFVCTANAADLDLVSGDRIVFAGDSITDAKGWTHYLSSYLILRNPDKLLHIQTEGRGGTTVQNYLAPDGGDITYQQYPKMVLPYQPKYVFTMFGHNGSATPEGHRAHYEDLIANYIRSGAGVDGYSGARPILIGPHPKANSDGKPILGAYEDQLAAIAAAGDYPFSATWHSLKPAWTDPEKRPAIGGSDDVHPARGGHIAIAYTVAKNLGWSSKVSSSDLDAVALKVNLTEDCVIRDLSGNSFGGIDFTRMDSRLPWAIDESGRSDALTILPEIRGWQKYLLTIRGLSKGTYEVWIDDEMVAQATDTQFLQGWNMADLTRGPVWSQCQEVLNLIRDMHGVDRVTLTRKGPPWQGVETYKSAVKAAYQTDGLRGQELIDSQAWTLKLIADLDAKIHLAAQPKNRRYSIRFKSAVLDSGLRPERTTGLEIDQPEPK